MANCIYVEICVASFLVISPFDFTWGIRPMHLKHEALLQYITASEVNLLRLTSPLVVCVTQVAGLRNFGTVCYYCLNTVLQCPTCSDLFQGLSAEYEAHVHIHPGRLI